MSRLRPPSGSHRLGIDSRSTAWANRTTKVQHNPVTAHYPLAAYYPVARKRWGPGVIRNRTITTDLDEFERGLNQSKFWKVLHQLLICRWEKWDDGTFDVSPSTALSNPASRERIEVTAPAFAEHETSWRHFAEWDCLNIFVTFQDAHEEPKAYLPGQQWFPGLHDGGHSDPGPHIIERLDVAGEAFRCECIGIAPLLSKSRPPLPGGFPHEGDRGDGMYWHIWRIRHGRQVGWDGKSDGQPMQICFRWREGDVVELNSPEEAAQQHRREIHVPLKWQGTKKSFWKEDVAESPAAPRRSRASSVASHHSYDHEAAVEDWRAILAGRNAHHGGGVEDHRSAHSDDATVSSHAPSARSLGNGGGSEVFSEVGGDDLGFGPPSRRTSFASSVH